MATVMKINCEKILNIRFMKKSVFFFILVILSNVVYSVSAQEEQQTSSLREIAERSTLSDNWFISLGGNANLLFAEQDQLYSPLKRIRYGGAIAVGKWFNPDFGARIQVLGGRLCGYNHNTAQIDGYYLPNHTPNPLGGNPYAQGNQGKYTIVKDKDGKEGFLQAFNYGTATFDLMANFTNLLRGHAREHNFIDVIPFAGFGVITAFNNNVTTPNYYHAVVKLGVQINFNINDRFSIYLEPQANATEKEFDGYAGTAIGDGIFNLGLGVQYTFNKKHMSLAQVARLTADEIDRVNSKINENRYLIENHQDILEKQFDLLDRLQKCCDESKKGTVNQVVEKTCLPDYVRFGLNSSRLEVSEQRKIVEVSDYLKEDPSSKLLIIGYADKKTGNSRYNLNLSQKRVETVAAELKRLGISTNRLIIEWKGDKEQPFPQNEWNRVVIMVERK
jgi:outer membrane protein OmpA-like peptidoglycan-associated protein